MPQKFLVPQYIEIEAKIFGPITVRQFIELLYAGLVGFIIWKIFENSNQTLGIGLILAHTMIWILIAFVKVNGQNFHYFALNLLRTMKKPKLRLWNRLKITSLPKEMEFEKGREIPTKILPPSTHLADLSLMVDTGGAYNVELAKEASGEKVEEINI